MTHNTKSDLLNFAKKEKPKGLEDWNVFLRDLYLKYSDNRKEVFS